MTTMITIRLGMPAIARVLAIFMKLRLLAGTGCASVICCAMPLSSIPMPSVMMKGSVFCCTTRNPLTKPTSAPQSTATAMAQAMGIYAIIFMAIIPERLIIDPMEKSHPPQMIVRVTPKAMISKMAAELSISSRL